MSIRIAVDTGGTFTDFVKLDENGLTVHKVRSTPENPARAMLTGIQDLLGGRPAVEVIHGSTVATNALLERKGARIAFVTTAGFEDILRIGRQTRRELYNFFVEEPRPLVEPDLTFGISERIGPDGSVIEPLSDSDLHRVLECLKNQNPESVAICLLHAYANPEHEGQLAKAIEQAGFPVSASHEILPEYREFERASAAAVNAYVTPVMSRYLTTLERSVCCDRLRITQSAGGFISAGEARKKAVQTVLSGPAAGAVGALALAQASGFDRVIAFDMGGTSTDVSLLDGSLPITPESMVGDFPIRLPMLDIHTVGAGGGSIAYLDAGGSLRVGPRSAGVVPGPVCYGLGDELTVTDANLLLGRIDPQSFLGGRMTLDLDRTRRVARQFAQKLNLSETELAEGIVRVANSNMERALRVVSVRRGHDPRDFALLAFGGAGGMHACDLAAALDIHTVLVPEQAGVLSALGMLLADYVKYYSRSVLRRAGDTPEDEIESAFEGLIASAQAELAAEGFERNTVTLERSLDLRYFGQSYEITVPFGPGYRTAFDEAHERLYGYRNDTRAVEIVNVRVKATVHKPKPQLLPNDTLPAALAESSSIHSAVFEGNARPAPLLSRDLLNPGMSGMGPAILANAQSTTVVPPGWRFRIDRMRTLVITRALSGEDREP